MCVWGGCGVVGVWGGGEWCVRWWVRERGCVLVKGPTDYDTS